MNAEKTNAKKYAFTQPKRNAARMGKNIISMGADSCQEHNCSNCHYYTDEMLKIWGEVTTCFRKCSLRSSEGVEEYTLDLSSCEHWQGRKEDA